VWALVQTVRPVAWFRSGKTWYFRVLRIETSSKWNTSFQFHIQVSFLEINNSFSFLVSSSNSFSYFTIFFLLLPVSPSSSMPHKKTSSYCTLNNFLSVSLSHSLFISCTAALMSMLQDAAITAFLSQYSGYYIHHLL